MWRLGMSTIRAVIFDFNGVLVDDEHLHFDMFREVLSHEGVEITARDYHERFLGLDDRGCFAAALSEFGKLVDDHQLDELIARKARRYREAASRGLNPVALRRIAVSAASRAVRGEPRLHRPCDPK